MNRTFNGFPKREKPMEVKSRKRVNIFFSISYHQHTSISLGNWKIADEIGLIMGEDFPLDEGR